MNSRGGNKQCSGLIIIKLPFHKEKTTKRLVNMFKDYHNLCSGVKVKIEINAAAYISSKGGLIHFSLLCLDAIQVFFVWKKSKLIHDILPRMLAPEGFQTFVLPWPSKGIAHG